MTHYLILVRHSISKQEPGISAHGWQLTTEGIARCRVLADRLRPYAPAVIISSEEPKAIQTGQAVADAMNVPFETEPALHEHRRENVPYGTQAAFEANVKTLLTHPDQLIFGEETGSAACDRFQAAIEAVVARHSGKTLAAVTHGTVMSLFLARTNGVDPVAFWQNLGMPAYVVLTLSDYRLIEVVNDVSGPVAD
jgi:broad specificity phosphatase PhoE